MAFDIIDDIRFTWRSLRRRPLFALTAIITLGLAIGANTFVFTLVNSILLKPLPVKEPQRLAELYTSHDDRVGGVSSYLDLTDLQSSTTTFDGLSGHSLLFANLDWNGRSETIIGEFCSWNYSRVLGIQPKIGRFFTPEEERSEGAAQVAVLGHRFWQSRFGESPSVLGQSVRLNGKPYSIVGVMPEGFEGMFPALAPEVWVPIPAVETLDSFGQIDVVPSAGNTKMTRRGYRWLWITGRLKDGVTLQQAQSEMSALSSKFASDFPQSNKDRQIAVKAKTDVRLNPEIDGALTASSAFLLVATGIVLLVACTNVAGMFLARSSARRREVAVRLALGTSRGRLIQQLLIESTSIALMGGAAGLLLALGLERIFTSMELPIPITIHWDLAPDWRVFIFTFGVSLLAGVSFGLIPALQSVRRNLVVDLKGGNDAPRRMIFRNALVVTQLAFSMILLVASGFLIRSLSAATKIDLGFAGERYALVQLNLGMYGYTGERSEAFYRDLEQRFKNLPGVEAVSMATRTPLSININTTALYATATPGPDVQPATFDDTDVDPGYFDALQIPIVEGRAIDERDMPNTTTVGVVSQSMAKRVWPRESAIGKQMRSLGGRTIEIVGVSRDYKVRTVGESPRPMIHFARRQSPNPSSAILVRASGRADTLLPLLREQVSTLDPTVVPFQLATLQSEAYRSLFPVRAGAAVLTGLGVFALFLAAVGLYGLIAYSVSRRTREIGTRIALGATRSDILMQIVTEGGKLVAIGVAVGLAGAAAAGQLLQSLLYGISSLDWASFLAGIAILGFVGLLANVIPAIAAARVDPIRALRND